MKKQILLWTLMISALFSVSFSSHFLRALYAGTQVGNCIGLSGRLSSRARLDVSAWSEIPLCRDGRVLPLDAFARTHVRLICGRENPRVTFTDGTRRAFQASEILFAWLAEPEAWEETAFIALDDGKLRAWMQLPLTDENGVLQTRVSPAVLSRLYNSVAFNERLSKMFQTLEESEKLLADMKSRGITSGSDFERETRLRAENAALREKLDALESRYVTWLRLTCNPLRNLTPENDTTLRDSAHVPYMSQTVTLSYLEQNLIYTFCNSYEPRLSLRGADLTAVSEEELAQIHSELKIPDVPSHRFSPAELYISFRKNPKLWKNVPFLYLENAEIRRLLELPLAPEGETPYLYASPMALVNALQKKAAVLDAEMQKLSPEACSEMNRLEMALQLYCYWLDGQYLDSIPLGQRFYTDYNELHTLWFGAVNRMRPAQPLDAQMLMIILQRSPELYQKITAGWRSVSPQAGFSDALQAGRISDLQWDFILSCMKSESPELSLFLALRKVSSAFRKTDASLKSFPVETPSETPSETSSETPSETGLKPQTETVETPSDSRSEHRLAQISQALYELNRAAAELQAPLEAYCHDVRKKMPETLAGTDSEWYSYVVVSRVSLRNFAHCAAALQYTLFDEDLSLDVLPALEGVPLDRNRTESVQIFNEHVALHVSPWLSLNALRFGGTDRNDFVSAYPAEAQKGMKEIRTSFQRMVSAWKEDRPEDFLKESREFAANIRKTAEILKEPRAKILPESEMDADALASTQYPATLSGLRLEVFYNRFRPFTWAWIFPFAATLTFLFSCVLQRLALRAKQNAKQSGTQNAEQGGIQNAESDSVRNLAGDFMPTPSYNAQYLCFQRYGNLAFWTGLVFLTLGVASSTLGLALRSWIMNRAPVTNMFETIVFVAWSAGVIGIWFAFRIQFARIMALGWNAALFRSRPESVSSSDLLPKPAVGIRAAALALRLIFGVVLLWILCFYGLGKGSGYTAIRMLPALAVGASAPSLSAVVEWLAGMLMLGALLWWLPLFLVAPAAGLIRYIGLKFQSAGTDSVHDSVRYSVHDSVHDSECESEPDSARSVSLWNSADLARLERLRFQRPFFAGAAALVVFVISYISVAFPDIFKPDLRNLAPILRDNYWLAIHVVTIVASYGAGMLAWGLANGALCCCLFGRYRRVEGKTLPPEICSTLSELLYRCMQVAVLLLVVGTILGGLWADVSWGKFWSWDRKEVWALISLFVYLLILHGRYVRILGEFTLAIGAVLGAFAIVMAWYGVNYIMGSALHGYGAGTGSLMYGGILTALNVALIFAAVIRYVCEMKK